MPLFNKWTSIGATAMLLLTAASALAQKPAQVAGKVRVVQPVRIAKVDGNQHLVGKWINYGTAVAPKSVLGVAFDCFEADATGAPTEIPAYGPQINPPGLEGQRYFYGAAAQNMFCANDMTVASGMAGANATRLDLAWYWNGTPGERCIVVVNTAETFGNTDAGPSFTTPYDGVSYDFGTTLAPGFYRTRIDLTNNLFHKMPVDGSGAYIMTIANNVTPETVTLASTAQPMLWLTKINNPSFQGQFQWDDDNPINGMHDAPAEFYDYLIPTISDRPLGAMIAFYAEAPVSSFNASSFNIIFGTQTGGNLASLSTIDSNYLSVFQTPFRGRTDPSVRVQFNGTAPTTTGSSIKADITLKTTAVPAANVDMRMEFFNFSTNSWVQVAAFAGSSANTTVTGTTSSLTPYLEPVTGNVRCRVSAFDPGNLVSRSWQVDFDEVKFTVNP